MRGERASAFACLKRGEGSGETIRLTRSEGMP